MVNGYKFLLKLTPAAISAERFPYYGHFYGCMGMQLLGEEFKDDKEFRDRTKGYIDAAQKDVAGWQQRDGSTHSSPVFVDAIATTREAARIW